MRKIIYSTILIIILSLVLVSFFIYNSYLTTKEIMMHRLDAQNKIFTQQTSNYIENYFTNFKRLLLIMGNSPEIQYIDKDNTTKFMQNFFNNFNSKAILDIGRIDNKGILRAGVAAPELIGKDFSWREYFKWAQKLENKNKIFISSTIKVMGVEPGTIGIVMTYPIYETAALKLHTVPGEKFSGVLIFIIQIKSLIKEVFPQDTALESSERWLLEDNGFILYTEKHPSLVEENIFSFLNKSRKIELSDFIKLGFKQKAGKGTYSCLFEPGIEDDYQDYEQLIYYHKIDLGNKKWLIGICTPKKAFMSKILSTFKTSILSTSLIILFLSLIGIIIFIITQNILKVKIQEKEKESLEIKVQEKTEELNQKNKELEIRKNALEKLNKEIEISKKELQQSEENYRTIVESSFAGIAVIQNNNFVFVNKKFSEILDCDKNELLGKSYFSFINEDNKNYVDKVIEKTLSGETTSTNFDIKMISKLNIIHDIDLWINLIDFKDQKAIRMSIRDITQSKKNAIEMRETKDKLEAIFNSITDAINIVDKNYIIKEANMGRANLHGWKLEEMIGHHCYEVFQNRDEICEGCPVNETFSTGKPAYRERSAKRSDGIQVIADVFTFPIFNENHEVSFVIEYARDITEKRYLENELYQSQKMESIGNIAGGIAHDFNNLISAILGYTSYIKSEVNINGFLYQQLEVVENAALKASELTRQLLTFSRKDKYCTKPISINKTIEDTIKLLSHSVNKGIEIKLNLSKNSYLIDGNEGQIQNMILNICLNAIDAIPQRGEIIIKTAIQEADETYIKQYPGLKTGEYILVSVSDNGMGMDEDTQKRIFEPFFTTKKDEK
ncbi:MAG: PAS domain S-box protein, partial [Candidatus Firestonebacteria bacterium]|nr:PAS domain S-box protein [Candidatus Firestonebacteria bacterium]